MALAYTVVIIKRSINKYYGSPECLENMDLTLRDNGRPTHLEGASRMVYTGYKRGVCAPWVKWDVKVRYEMLRCT